ncbi:AAA family ATPase [Ignavibacteriales bacterium]
MSQKFSLQSIEIKGFKSFNSEGQKLVLGDLTVLIGANGAGKSNLISFFKMITSITNSSLQNFIGVNGGANAFLHFGAKHTKQMESQLKFKAFDHEDLYRFVLSHAVGESLIFSDEEVQRFKNGKPNQNNPVIKTGQGESVLIQKNDFNDAGTFPSLLSRLQVYQFHDTSKESPLKRSVYLEDNKYLRSDGGNLAAILYALKNSDKWNKYYSRIVTYIRYALPEFDDFDLEPDVYNGRNIMLNWRAKYSDHLFGPHQLSDGSLRFMALMTLLLRPKELLPPIVIIDEPELGLHPSAISILANVINMVKSETQIIIATQSTNMVDQFDPSEIVVVEKDRKDNCTKLKRLDLNSLQEWLEEYSLSELWEKNVFGGKP